MELASSAFFILQMLLLFFWAYWFFISLFGFGKAKKARNRPPQKKFLILIPAHNEENVIGDLVENLLRLDYPKGLYDVYVIADNCNDRTAEITREKGGNALIHTYLPGEPKGKPYAIRYALDVLNVNDYDAVCIFDADNLVSLNYLQQMNNHLLCGERLIQCYLDSKNPNDNWISLSYATSYFYMNRSWQLAKYRLGLGNAIGGTGFCVDRELLQSVGWTATSLTEDLEFTMQCLLRGVKATWCHHARVYDEKPLKFIPSCIQRLRWARGHWDVCFRYATRLLWQAISKADIKALDGFLYLVNPGKIVLGTLVGITFYLSYFSGISLFQPFIPMWLWLVLIAFQFLYISGCIIYDGNRELNKFKAFFSLFLLNYSYVPLFVFSAFTFKKRVWVRTDHNRTLTGEETKQTLEQFS